MSVGRSMTVADLRKYFAKLKSNLRGADSAIVRGIHSGVMRSIAVVHSSVDNAMPASPNGSIGAVNTGEYKRRWQFELTATGGRVFNDHPAADVIERGRRAGSRMPPPDTIKLWVKQRLGLSDEEAEKAKFPIALAIAKRGLAGRRVLTNPGTSGAIIRIVMEEVREEIRSALKRAKNG